MALKSTKIYQLKMTLDSIRPPIWRRVQVRSNISLGELHDIIQSAMGWQGGHMHQFVVGNTYYSEPDPEFDAEDENKAKLSKVAPSEKSKFKYEYDFGDGWDHTILVEKILPAEADIHYPRCLTGKRACPPEDCGGPYMYPEFLDAIANPANEQHADMLEWVGGKFDPEYFDLAEVNAALQSPGNREMWIDVEPAANVS
jgi:hypothetical protein